MLIETIRIEHGRPHLLDLHYARVCRSAEREGLPLISHETFVSRVRSAVETGVCGHPGRFKLRLQYSSEIHTMEVQRYTLRSLQSAVMFNADDLEYESKFADRRALDRYQEVLGPRAIALYVKQGLITDLWYANVVLRRGGVWYTPASPLLRGVMRERLLDRNRGVSEARRERFPAPPGGLSAHCGRFPTRPGRTPHCGRIPVVEADIPAADIASFEVLSPINAMLDPGDIEIPTTNIGRLPRPRA